MTDERPLFAAYDPDGRRRELPTPAGIRAARPTDRAACARLAVERNGGDPRTWEARFTTDFADATVLVTVADLDEEGVVGVGRVGWMTMDGEASDDGTPDGYYLTDLIVAPAWRRHGLGEAITRARLAWVWERSDTAWYVVNASNLPSLDLHSRLGFRVVTDDVSLSGVTFVGGRGLLCRADRP